MDASSLMPLAIDGEMGYPRLTPHEQRNIDAESYEYGVCRKCILEECDDTDPRCPLPAINAEKRKEERPKRKGQGTAVSVVILNVAYASTRQACIYLGISHGKVYAYSKKNGLTPQAVLTAWAGFTTDKAP